MTVVDPHEIELVVTDLDGSLWDSSCTLHPETTTTLKWLAQRDLPLLVATGRRRISASRPLDAVGLDSLPRVLLNGTLGIDGAEVFHKTCFEADHVASILDAFADADHVPCAYVDHDEVDVYCTAEPTTSLRHRTMLDKAITIGDRDTLLSAHDVVGFSILGVSPDLLESVAAVIESSRIGEAVWYGDDIYGGYSLMVAPPGVSKWTGILAYCERNDIDPTRVAAVGDANNDLEMLHEARVSFVASNGSTEARALADVIVDPPTGGGWQEIRRTLHEMV